MMRQRGIARSLGITLVAVVVIGTIGFLVTRPPVPYPSESHRVVHPGGFSVIAPPGWDHFLAFTDGRRADAINIAPTKTVRSNASMLVSKLLAPVTPEGLARKQFTATTFQGRPAFANANSNVYMKDHARGLLFERDGAWYELIIRGPELEPLDNGVWLAYAESFRVEPVVRALPTSVHVPAQVSTKPAP